MSNQSTNSLYTEALSWLRDMGCDEPVNDIKRTFYGLRSKENISKVHFNNINIKSKSIKSSIDSIGNINDLNDYVRLNLLPNNTSLYSKFAFFDGYEEADLMIIGDKPDSLDIKIGKPFQGEIGNLLNAMLKAISFNRSNTFFTNIHFYNTDIQIDISLQIVKKQIEIVKPKIIVLLGAEATKSLLKIDKGIFQTRGKWFSIENLITNSVLPCISMFHPRYVLAHPHSKKETWLDLQAIRDKLS
jgi:uracil-DNA glycosylase